MLATPYCVSQYSSAKQRFFKPSVVRLLMQSFPAFFGKRIAEKFAEQLIELFEQLHPERDFLKPGQILWNALDKNTRADSPNRRFIPVTITVVNEQDIEQLCKGIKHSEVRQLAMARMYKEVYEQGGLLSSRDLSLLTLANPRAISRARIEYETKAGGPLPHPGVLHDMGPCITHKRQIVYKVIVEKQDPAMVAQQTNHSQPAVDRYLQDYHRVKTVFQVNEDIDYIHLVTNIAKNVVKQYIELYQQFENSPSKMV